MQNDFNTLMSATNLATSGVGTFSISAAMVSIVLRIYTIPTIFWTGT